MSTSMLLAGKCCLVVGATDPKSVGYACAKTLLDAGAKSVTISGRNQKTVNEAATSLRGCYGVVCDLRKPETMKNAVEDAVKLMNGSLDILIVAGGNGGSEYLGLDTDSVDSYRLMQDVAVHSPMMLTRCAHPYLKKAASSGTASTVVMVSSMASHVPWPDTAPYNIAKAGQNCLIQNLAFEYRQDNIRVNAVSPSCIHTGQLDIMAAKKGKDVQEYAQLRANCHPLQRNGTPTEVANAVLYLASPNSNFTTGTLLELDGGLHLTNWFNQPKILKEYVGGTGSGKP